MTFTKFAAGLVLALGLVACAGVNFVKPADDQLVFGSTTKSQVVAMMGREPNGKGQKVSNGETVEIISYAYANVGSGAVFEGVTAARALGFYFHNDRLVGTEFTSSFHEGHTYYDPEKAKSIKKGMGRAEVVTLLGPAGGEYRFPLIADPKGKALVYVFTQTKGFSSQQNVLVVELDDAGTVQKSDFTQIGHL